MNGETFSISEALRFGWETFKRNLATSVGLVVASVGAMFLLNGMTQALQRHATLTFGFSLLAQVAQMFFAFLWIRFALTVYDGRQIRARELVPDGMMFLNYLAVSIIYGLLVTAGLILLVVPGLYLAVRYGLVGFLVADGRTDVLGAFREASGATRGLRWKLFLFALALFVLNAVGAIFLGVGLLVTLPMSAFAAVLVYRRLATRVAHERVIVGPPMPV